MKSIGLDIGTTSISGVLMDTESQKQLGSVTIPNDTALKTGASWERSQDPELIFSKCMDVIAGFQREQGEIGCIGVTGQMHGTLYCNGRGQAVSPLYTWEDGRGDLIFSEGETYAEALTRLTGYPMSTGYGLTTHFYNLNNGLLPKNAQSMCTAADYVAMRLCGNKRAVTHPTNGAGFGAFKLDELEFDVQAVEKAGISPTFLPCVVKSEKVIGHIPGGVPVSVPIGDNQAGILGSVTSLRDVVLNIGTSSQISVISDSTQVPEGLDCRPYIDGKYIWLGAGLCGGSAFRMLNRFFRQVCEWSGTISQDEMDDLMMASAKQAYGEIEPPCVRPLFRGTRGDPGKRGSIEDISMENLTPGSLTLGFYRGVCEEMLTAYNKMPDKAKSEEKLMLSGNAARKNPLLVKIIEETFGRKACMAQFREEAAAGAALLAAAAINNQR